MGNYILQSLILFLKNYSSQNMFYQTGKTRTVGLQIFFITNTDKVIYDTLCCLERLSQMYTHTQHSQVHTIYRHDS